MLKRFRPRLSFANVMSSIAVFLALGGGYAMAFAGSGTLQKGSKTNLTLAPTTVRTLTGIGDLEARCATSPSDRTLLQIHNSSGEDLWVAYRGEGDGTAVVADGEVQNTAVPVTENGGTTRVHIWPDDGSKAPQAEVVVSTFRPTGGDCTGPTTASSATALVLNTQQ